MIWMFSIVRDKSDELFRDDRLVGAAGTAVGSQGGMLLIDFGDGEDAVALAPSGRLGAGLFLLCGDVYARAHLPRGCFWAVPWWPSLRRRSRGLETGACCHVATADCRQWKQALGMSRRRATKLRTGETKTARARTPHGLRN